MTVPPPILHPKRPAWRNSPQHWGRLSILLHWLTALLVLLLMFSGWIAQSMHFSPTQIEWFVWHKSLGLLVLLLTALRLLWLLWSPRPHWKSVDDVRDAARNRAGKAVHLLLYVLLLLMPLSGWVLNSAANFPLRWFHGPRVPDLVAANKGLKLLAEDLHLGLFWLLAALLAVHIAAVIWHVRRGDGVLKRMLGRGK